MSYSGVVFFDYDGTLTDENEGIFAPTDKTKEAVKSLHENGYLTVLATGRMKPLTTLVWDLFDGLITSDGSYAELFSKPLLDTKIPKELLCQAMEYMRNNNIFYALENQTCAYTNGCNDPHFLEVLDHFKLSRELYRPISEAKEIFANKMIVSYEDEKKADEMAVEFHNKLTVKKHRFCLSSDIDLDGITKATGIKAILKETGIGYNNTYAFGDGENDRCMLSCVAHPVAMGIHSKLLDDVLEFSTLSVAEDGIYHALKNHYKII